MTKRRKKQNILWRALRFVVVGLAKGIWWVLKNAVLGLHHLFILLFRKIKEKKKETALRKQPHYSTPAAFASLEVVQRVSGEFEVFEKRLLEESLIVLIFGKRGSGKSALGFRALENIHFKTQRKCYVLGVRQEVLPQWIASVEDIDSVANGGIVLVDEGALAFSSRESMAGKNRELGKLMAIARHKDLTLLFITQNTGMLDNNVLKLADTLFIKEGSLLQLEMERPEIKKFYEKATKAFAELSGDRKRLVYIVDSDFEGVIGAGLPGFWDVRISKNKSG